MPWKVVKRGSKFAVVKKDGGGTVGTHTSRAKADAQVRALYSKEKKR